MTLRIVLAEDQVDARAWLVGLLSKMAELRVVADVGGGDEAVEAIERLAPNLVLLDVQMPRLNGIGVVERLGAAMPPTIFVTAHDSYAIRAFELSALDYLLKPFGPARLHAAIERARAHLQRDEAGVMAVRMVNLVDQLRGRSRPRRVSVRSGDRTLFLDCDTIDWLEARDDGVVIHAGAMSYAVREPLDALLQRLPPEVFGRVHKSHAINLSRVAELAQSGGGYCEVVLTTGVTLRVSRQRRELLLQQLSLVPGSALE
jgi:two-component system LytT family response regulator